DHGTNIVESSALVDEVKRRGIGLTCCPMSNRFVTDDTKATEIVDLLHGGVRVTVNSDDPAYFGGYVNENLSPLRAQAGLGISEVARLARNAFEIAWLTPRAREGYLAELDAYCAMNGVAATEEQATAPQG